jgi:hypothetical protein
MGASPQGTQSPELDDELVRLLADVERWTRIERYSRGNPIGLKDVLPQGAFSMKLVLSALVFSRFSGAVQAAPKTLKRMQTNAPSGVVCIDVCVAWVLAPGATGFGGVCFAVKVGFAFANSWCFWL